MRYIVVPEDTAKDHPIWPNERVYRVKDLKTGMFLLGIYKSEDSAKKIMEKKNASC